jgi:hypothetical protein
MVRRRAAATASRGGESAGGRGDHRNPHHANDYPKATGREQPERMR